MGFTVDLTGKTDDDLDRDGFAPPGWAKVSLYDVTTNNESGDTELTFEVINHLAGSGLAGAKVVEKLKNPDYCKTADEAKKSNDKGAKWAKRLGALPAELPNGKCEPDFISCTGNEYVLDIERREFKGKDGLTRTHTGPKYLGVYPLDHPDIPDAVRRELALPPAKPREQKGTAGGRASASTVAAPTGGASAVPSTGAGRREVDVSGL